MVAPNVKRRRLAALAAAEEAAEALRAQAEETVRQADVAQKARAEAEKVKAEARAKEEARVAAEAAKAEEKAKAKKAEPVAESTPKRTRRGSRTKKEEK
tara:strand:- start:2187 stop:2483 length:297 start_codon:yes stop_codon:yes gene_type:complete